ncbi:MAG: tyrosine-type recombinase/integrase [Nitrospinota bacterium]|nr:tyrosine-type recombinase/integrase [Nitrospinota bacterium]
MHHRILAAIGISPFKLHGLRSVASSHWRARRMPEDLIAYYMGHADYATTDKHYVRLIQEQMDLGRSLITGQAGGSAVVAWSAEK